MQIIFSEKELEDFLCEKGRLKQQLGLEFIARQVQISPAGIVDILAYDKQSSCFVIIELKKDLLDLNALAQGMSYLKYFQELKKFNYVNRRRLRKFALLFIGQNLDNSLEKVVDLHCIDETYEDNKIYYKLFGIDFSHGIDFSFYNKGQSSYAYRFAEIMDELETQVIKKFDIRF